MMAAHSSSGATNVENVKRFMNQLDIHNLKLADTNHDFRKNDCAGRQIVTQLTSNISGDSSLITIFKKNSFEYLAMVHFFNRLNLYGNIREITFVNKLNVPDDVAVSDFTKIRLQPRGESSGYSANLRSHVLYATGAKSYNEVYVVNDGVKSTVLVNGGAFDGGSDSVYFVQSIARSSDSATMGPVGNKRYIAKDPDELLYVANSYNQFTGLFEKERIISSFVLDANYGHLGNNLDKFEQKIRGPGGEATISYHGKNAGPSISQLSSLYCETHRALGNREADASAVHSMTGADKGWFLDEKRAGDYRQILIALRLRELGKKVLFISLDRLAVTLAVLLGVPAGLINAGNTDITLFKSDEIISYSINPVAGTDVAKYTKRRNKKILERMGTLYGNYPRIRNKMLAMRTVIKNRYNILKEKREAGTRTYKYTLTEWYDIYSMRTAINTIDIEIRELDTIYTGIRKNLTSLSELVRDSASTETSAWNTKADRVLTAIYSSFSVDNDNVEQVLTRLERLHDYRWTDPSDFNNVRIQTDVLEYNYENSGKVNNSIKQISVHNPPGSPAPRRKDSTRYNNVKRLVSKLYNTYLMKISDADVSVLLGMSHTDFKTRLIENPLNDTAADKIFDTALQRIIRTDDAVGPIPDVPLFGDERSEDISRGVARTEAEAVKNNKIQARTSVYRRIPDMKRRIFRVLSQIFDTYSEGGRGRQQTGGNRIDSYMEDYYVSVDMLIGECMYLFTESSNIGIPSTDVFNLTTEIICNVVTTYICVKKIPQMIKDGSYEAYWKTIRNVQSSFESVSNISGVIIDGTAGSYHTIYGEIRKNIFKKQKDLEKIVRDINVDIDSVVSRLMGDRIAMKTDMRRYRKDDKRSLRRDYGRDDKRSLRRDGRDYGRDDDEDVRRRVKYGRDEDRVSNGYYDDLKEVIDTLYETYNKSAAAASASSSVTDGYDTDATVADDDDDDTGGFAPGDLFKGGFFKGDVLGAASSSSSAASEGAALREALGRQVYGRKSMSSQTKRRSRKCPRGTIRRKAYKTKRGVTVRSSCIKDRGLPGKGKRLFTLKKGELGKYGYSLKQAREKRRVALNKARKELSHATLVRKINALSILMKNTRPDYSRRARADVKWLGKTRA